MTNYPTSFPADSAGVIVEFVRGGTVTKSHALHAAWDVVGYAAGQFSPDVVILAGEKPLTNDEAIAHLEGCRSGAKQAGALPWGAILAWLLQNLLPLILPFLKPAPTP
jgi:hypothetical protein